MFKNREIFYAQKCLLHKIGKMIKHTNEFYL